MRTQLRAARRAPLLVLVLTLMAAAFSGCGSAAELEVTPSSHDFGRVRRGLAKKQEFTLHNGSSEDVTLMLLEPNCSCFSVSNTFQRKLPAGESTKFTVRFDSIRLPPQRLRGKRLEIRASVGTDVRQLVIPLEGEIFAPFDVDVEALRFGPIDGRPENYEPRRIRVRQLSDFRVELDKSNPMLKKGYRLTPEGQFEVTEEKKPDGFDLVVRLKKDARALGRLYGYIQMQIKVFGEDLDGHSFTHSAIKLDGTWEPNMWPLQPAGVAEQQRPSGTTPK